MIFEDSDSIGEFDIIKRYFKRQNNRASKMVSLGIGDDCALLQAPPPGEQFAITSDMLVEGRHFFKDANPEFLGYKCLAVNLSDLAAIGAKPIAYNLSISLPTIREEWLASFSKGIHQLADEYNCELLGGDTTAGPLSIAITAIGSVAPDQALRRDRAQIGDDIWVSNTVGDARLVLGFRRGEWQMDMPWQSLRQRMDTPTPRTTLGLGLRGIANSAIDISDGLLGDLDHILESSKVSANIWIDQVPCSPLLKEVSLELRRLCTLKGGDDYELCFTAPPKNRTAIEHLSQTLQLPLTRIGEITPQSDPIARLKLLDADMRPLPQELTKQYVKSFDHFK
jgi:thiamine-monophosphate kinase